jgi:hypothetical protein
MPKKMPRSKGKKRAEWWAKKKISRGEWTESEGAAYIVAKNCKGAASAPREAAAAATPTAAATAAAASAPKAAAEAAAAASATTGAAEAPKEPMGQILRDRRALARAAQEAAKYAAMAAEAAQAAAARAAELWPVAEGIDRQAGATGQFGFDSDNEEEEEDDPDKPADDDFVLLEDITGCKSKWFIFALAIRMGPRLRTYRN